MLRPYFIGRSGFGVFFVFAYSSLVESSPAVGQPLEIVG